MDIIIKIADALALILQFVGTLFMYLNSPVNKPEGVVYLKNFGETSFAVPKRRNKMLRVGFLTLAIGCGVALISLILKDFAHGMKSCN
ncbi:hypothetical protein [Mucilaginibacter ximonensis]|uniref:hypothetical protein n=1 Tax=Mucilaginibacter ximonensis TaxID=538021 RepID=UPI00366F53F2